MTRRTIAPLGLSMLFLTPFLASPGALAMKGGRPEAESGCRQFGRSALSFDRGRIGRVFDQVRGNGQFPAIGSAPSYFNQAQPAPADLQAIFEPLQEAAFGRPVLELKTSAELDGNLILTDTAHLRIVLSLNHLESLRQAFPTQAEYVSALRFILAHELSHYVYERGIQLSPRRASPHGNPSLIPQGPGFNPGSRREAERLFEKLAKSHAEIDAFGLVLLAKAGALPAPDAVGKVFAFLERPPGAAQPAEEPGFLQCIAMQEIRLRTASSLATLRGMRLR